MGSVHAESGVKLSQHQKFRKMMLLCQEICSLGSEVGMQQFEERYSVLKSIRDDWKLGRSFEQESSKSLQYFTCSLQ